MACLAVSVVDIKALSAHHNQACLTFLQAPKHETNSQKQQCLLQKVLLRRAIQLH